MWTRTWGYSTLSLRAAATMQFGGMQIVPHLSAAWQHAFDDVTPGAALAVAATGIGFGISHGRRFVHRPIRRRRLDNGVKGRLTWLF